MSIGTTIKRLRRERGITQEQLAEYLGITSRAVSQWECDRTTPDISQIPVLCHIFGVTSDELLGIDIENNETSINNYLKEAFDKLAQGDFEEAVKILREANQKFPKSYKIMQELAVCLVDINSRKGKNEYEEVFALCQKVLDECTDSMTRYRATQTLGYAYGYAGKTDEMLKLANVMPPTHYSYENFMLYRWQGDADIDKRKAYMSYLITNTLEMIGCLSEHRHDDGTLIYTPEEIAKLQKLRVDLLEMFFNEGDYQFLAQYGEIACSNLVDYYLNKGDTESAWYWLEKSADFAIDFCTYDFDSPHTSLLLRGYSSGGWIIEADGNRAQWMLDKLLSDEEIDVFRKDVRFEKLVARLKRVAKKRN